MGKKRSPASRDLSGRIQAAFGQRLQECRAQAAPRFSQQMIASALEVSRTSVSNIENGRHRIFLDQVYAAARVLRVPVAALLPNDEDLSSPSVHAAPNAGLDADQLEALGSVVEAAIRDSREASRSGSRKRTT